MCLPHPEQLGRCNEDIQCAGLSRSGRNGPAFLRRVHDENSDDTDDEDANGAYDED